MQLIGLLGGMSWESTAEYYLAVLETRAPGRSVEVRVPPYAAVQCVEGLSLIHI